MNLFELVKTITAARDLLTTPRQRERLLQRLAALLRRRQGPTRDDRRRWTLLYHLPEPPLAFRTWFIHSRRACGKSWCHCRRDGRLHPTGHLVAWHPILHRKRKVYVGACPLPADIAVARRTLYKSIRADVLLYLDTTRSHHRR